MRRLVQLNLLQTFRLKTWGITTLLFFFIAIVQVVLLHQNRLGLEVNVWDYMIFSNGGVLVGGRVWQIFGWVISIFPIMLYIHHLVGVTGGFDQFLLTRAGSRGIWWLAKVIATTLLAVLYSAWFVLIHLCMGVCFYRTESTWSSYFQDQYTNLFELHVQPAVLVGLVFLIFVTGIIAFAVFAQAFLMIFKNSSTGYTVLTIVLLVFGEGYIQGMIGRKFSILTYASFVDLFQFGGAISSFFWREVEYNLIFSFCCFLLSVLLVRRHPLC